MNDIEEKLFEKYEKKTNHRQMLLLIERLAKSGWLVMAIAIGAFILVGQHAASYAFLFAALALLGVSLVLGFMADKIRKSIQDEVDRELGK